MLEAQTAERICLLVNMLFSGMHNDIFLIVVK